MRRIHRILLLSIGILWPTLGKTAVTIPPLPTLKTYYTAVQLTQARQARSLIVVPDSAEYLRLGNDLATALWQVSGTTVAVKGHTQLSSGIPSKSNAILLGYFANNSIVERLYDEHFVSLDTRWPGEGSYVVRTVHDPCGMGTSFLYLGGTDPASVGKAVAEFIADLPASGDVVCPHTLKVVGPDGPLHHKRDATAVRQRIRSSKGKSFNTLANMFCAAGLGYHRTGDPDELEVLKGVAAELADLVRQHDRLGDTWGQRCFANIWDLVEEAPVFSPLDRKQITQLLWELTHRSSYCGRVARQTAFPEGNLSSSRMAVGLARYWKKYYGLDAGGLDTWANARSRSQASFWRPREDCPGYGSITVCDTLFYVLHYGYDKYWTDGTGRRMADYGVAIINNLGGIAGFGDTSAMGSASYWPAILRIAGWKLKDGRYLAAEKRASAGGNVSLINEYSQREVAPAEPSDMLGVHVVGLPDWVWEQRQSVLGTAPVSMNPVLDADPVPPREQCFDKITFRNGFDPRDQYLILGGVSHGYHAHPDGNAIIELTDEGRYCLFDSGYFVPDTIEHNSLIVFRDGLFEPVPRLTGLDCLGDFVRRGMTSTYVNDYNGVNWHRNIIWSKEQFFLVIDEVQALKAGNYRLSAVFRTLDDDRPEVANGRVRARYAGKDFCLVSASQTPLDIAGTTPPASTRHAIVQTAAKRMTTGDKHCFMNLLFTTDQRDRWPYDLVPVAPGIAMVKTPEGYALAGAGSYQPMSSLQVDAKLFYLDREGFSLTAGTALNSDGFVFAANTPVNIDVLFSATAGNATGTVQTKAACKIYLGAEAGTVRLNGTPVRTRAASKGQELEVPTGRHTLHFMRKGNAEPFLVSLPVPTATDPETATSNAQWAEAYAQFRAVHEKNRHRSRQPTGDGHSLKLAWKVENAEIQRRTVYVNEHGKTLEDLTNAGKATCWTQAQRGASPANAVDGNPKTYSATSTSLSWTNDLPKDIGMRWDNAMQVGCLQIDYYSPAYAPTMAGQQLQMWDGKDWCPIKANIEKDETGARWSYRFAPLATTRLRVFITEFSAARTAVREMRVFAEPVVARQRDVRLPATPHALAARDLDGDGKISVLAAVGKWVKRIDDKGTVVWQQQLPKEALCVTADDLDGDGRMEIVAGCEDHQLYCFDSTGKRRWSVKSPADPHFGGTEPASGAVAVVGCNDMDGDGNTEIVVGSTNWFAYGYDKDGKLLWTKLNWAHPPTSIAFVDLGKRKRGALIGTKYCAANLIGPGGKQVTSVSVGYHGAAMSVAAGDMDGNGKPELLVGSRVGGVHCQELGTRKQWSKFMGAEVTQVALADLDGDGQPEALAGSRNAPPVGIRRAGQDLVEPRCQPASPRPGSC